MPPQRLLAESVEILSDIMHQVSKSGTFSPSSWRWLVGVGEGDEESG